MNYSFSDFPSPTGSLTVAPEDRVIGPADTAGRAARQRFTSVLIAAIALHAILLLVLFLHDRADANVEQNQTEIPVELVTEIPQPPPPPPPEEKKREKVEKPQPEKPKVEWSEKAAHDAPRDANQETEKRLTTDQVTQGPMQAKPVLGSEAKPDTSLTQTAAPDPAEKTVSRDTPDDKPDAEPLDKAAPEKAPAPQQKTKPTKERSKIPNDQKEAVARLAALAPAPNFAFASASKITPVGGGTEDMRYLTVVWGLILRQKHDPPSVRTGHLRGIVTVSFYLDDTGRMVQEAVFRTSGYPDMDAEALAAIKRASPFPPPPYGMRPQLHATIEFKE
ncbi:MAG: cell envelope integrity protein TolA [Beijerinckiaceae bacterium]